MKYECLCCSILDPFFRHFYGFSLYHNVRPLTIYVAFPFAEINIVQQPHMAAVQLLIDLWGQWKGLMKLFHEGREGATAVRQRIAVMRDARAAEAEGRKGKKKELSADAQRRWEESCQKSNVRAEECARGPCGVGAGAGGEVQSPRTD